MNRPSEPTMLYIAGPMTGIPDFNYPAFEFAEQRLLVAGYDVRNPVRSANESTAPIDKPATWQDYMRNGINQLIRVDGIALLPGWLHSRGASLEVNIGQQLGLDVRDLTEWLRAAEERAA